MSSKSRPSVDNAFRVMLRTYGYLGRVMQPYFTQFGITGAQWGVLRSLHRAAEEGQSSIRLTDLSQRLIIRPPSVTTLVVRLERMGLVARDTSNTDRRAKQLRLTAAGRRLVNRVLKRHDQQIAAVLSGLRAAEQKQLRRLLQKWMRHLQSLTDRKIHPHVPIEPPTP